jgi:hypothetical protein
MYTDSRSKLFMKFVYFMEPEGLLPCSQRAAIGYYNNPTESNPTLNIRFILILYILVLFSHLGLDLQRELLL